MDTLRRSNQAVQRAVYHLRKVRRKLLRWYERNRRDLPWRRTRDPYRIWLSEVMLQQTRVAAVEPYYLRFLRLFPTVEALARARPQRVLRAWAGLGYYTRARALHATARKIRAAGRFPSTYQEWLALPGVGPYTAAAVASIACGRPHAVLDGNVRRVLSRLFASADGLEEKADALLDRKRPGDFNQALMELGATVCLPRAPLCAKCPLAEECRARRSGTVARFPPPKQRLQPQHVRLQLALVESDAARGSILLARPSGHGLWPRFWSLPELPHPALERLGQLGSFRHTVTFRNIHVQVFRARPRPRARLSALRFVTLGDLTRLPLSTPSRKALLLGGWSKKSPERN